MGRFWGYLLGALLVLPLLCIIPSCKTADKGAQKLSGVAEQMKQGSAGQALEELDAEEGESDEGDDREPTKEDEEAQLW